MTEATPPLLLERMPPQQGANELLLAAPLPEFRVGRTLRRCFRILKQHPLALLLPIAAIHLIRELLVWLQEAWLPAKSDGISAPHLIGGVLFVLVVSALDGGIVAHAALEALRGAPLRLGMAMRRSLARSGAMIGATLCSAFLVYAGVILLIVPGVYAQTAFLVVVPACVIEVRGPLASLKRSADLTRGYRWRILGIWLLLFIVISVLSFIGVKLAAASKTHAVSTTITIARFVMDVVENGVSAVLNMTIYYDLRVAKEGDDLGRIAAVFD